MAVFLDIVLFLVNISIAFLLLVLAFTRLLHVQSFNIMDHLKDILKGLPFTDIDRVVEA